MRVTPAIRTYSMAVWAKANIEPTTHIDDDDNNVAGIVQKFRLMLVSCAL